MLCSRALLLVYLTVMRVAGGALSVDGTKTSGFSGGVATSISSPAGDAAGVCAAPPEGVGPSGAYVQPGPEPDPQAATTTAPIATQTTRVKI